MNPVKNTVGVLSKSRKAVSSLSVHGKMTINGGKSLNINPQLVCLLRPRSAEAESYSRLRLALEKLRKSDRGFVVAVTSPGQGDGKTLTAINLAGALAQDTKARILLVDLDLREPDRNVCDYLDQKKMPGPGVVDWIGTLGLGMEQLVRYLPRFNLYVTLSGSKANLPYENLKSSRLDNLISEARNSYDFIILDAPKVIQLPDTELISRLVDGFVIVIKADVTPRKMLEQTLNLMPQDKVLGLVLNGASESL